MANRPTAHTVPTSPQDRDPPGRPASVRGVDLTTDKRGKEKGEPHLPHERDQDISMTGDRQDPRVQQGARDLQRGLQDTDEGLRADEKGEQPRQ
ncbi:hypothetical protein [Melaminivora alkalimesophila]|uniref:Uncharacterized protein n=1 Tax=Melaminivora alkalimesophila TaxID=1165852 RepID=A0A317RCU9_9BURK|nr:hypothetical protein [Melaminivora alkalimesophila]PWW46913.1 hypothetical protein DFR36_103188 [Melaminivora alkalimesophila]